MREEKIKSGIYKITNLINNKIYIGMSIYINRRWNVHKWDLKNNKHHSFHLQRAYNKYGEKNFKFEVLEYYPKENLELIEQCWLNFYKAYDRKLGYNIELGCKKISDETRLKMSISGKNKKVLKPRKKHIQEKIYQYDLKGLFIKEWFSNEEISNFYNGDRSHLSKSCREHTIFKNFQWRYKKDMISTNSIEPYKSLNLKLLSYEIGDTKITFIGSKEASLYFNKDISTIGKWLSGKLKFPLQGVLKQIL